MWQEYLFPASVDEAVATLADKGGRARLVAGGTDLIIELREGKRRAECLLDVTRIEGLDRIEQKGDRVVIGPNVTFRQLMDWPLIQQRATVLAEASRAVGSPQIRNVATIGGNVVSAQPAADGTIALLALGAEAEIASGDGRRWEPLVDLFVRPGVSRIDATAEMLTALRFPALGRGQGSAFERIARRRTLVLPILNCGVVVGLDETGEAFRWARIALGPVAPVPFRARQTEEWLAGRPAGPETFEAAGRVARGECQPRTSVLRASKEYREEMIEVLVRRGLERAVARAREGR